MSSTGIGNEYVTVGIGIVVVLTFLYFLVIRGMLLAWIQFLFMAGFFYLSLRLVKAVERIATALEDGSDR